MDDIVREGHPALREITKPVPMPLSQEDRDSLHCMLQFLKNSQDEELAEKYKLRSGVGLSANQVGLNKRMFVMYTSDEQGRLHEYALVNPKIVSHSVSMIYLPESEGCLSVDRPIQGFVPRYESVKVKAYDLCKEQAVLLKFKGYTSIVIQHEMDHLDGVMFYDRINQENPFKLPPNVPIRSLYSSREE